MNETKRGGIVLRPYQRDIIERAANASGNVLIEAPTGSGKSVMAKALARLEVERGGKVLIVAPKIMLLDQLAAMFADLGPEVIHGQKKHDIKAGVFVSTVQTAHRRKLGFTPSLILIDEVHHGFTGKMIKKLLEDFDGKLIGLSATPYDKEGKPLKGFDLHLNAYDTRYMIERGYLVPVYSYAPVKVNLEGIRTTAGDYNQSDLEERFNTIESIMQVVGATKAVIKERKQAIVFCITINHAEAMAAAYRDAGIEAHAMHSQLSKEERDRRMEAFRRGDIKLLTNPDMLTTGFDHPPTDTVVLARATKSQNLYRQMVGRVLRPCEGKSDAVLLDCAGVVNELGLPTDPIRPRRKRQIANGMKRRCEECGGDRVYRRVVKSRAYWQCPECGHYEAIEPKGYACEGCGRIWGNDGRYSAKDGKLLLLCDCGHESVVSEATSEEALRAIFDPAIVAAVQKRVVAGYALWLIEKKGAAFITTPEAARQIRTLNAYVKDHPDAVPRFEESIVRQPDGWRIFPREYEIGAKSVEKMRAAFYNANRFTEAARLLDELLQLEGKPPLKRWVIEKTLQQLESSPVEGIERMTVKRLKNLYSKRKDCNTIDTFIPFIEEERGVTALPKQTTSNIKGENHDPKILRHR
ncbi:helicase-related protein [Hydrogenimonas urashimensis]|uniref:helicase-related protein n=1 Tax=Hydrogenimonas urashimensis TaxID=2740515 RepID=UPI001915D9DD|nr:helicase-related protein [Hydrogenimonas urashimensis]